MTATSPLSYLRFGFLTGVFLFLGLSYGAAVEFSHFYDARELPELAVPAWAQLQKGGTVSVEDGVLSVSVDSDKRQYYGLGVFSDGTAWGDSDAWKMTGSRAIIEFSVRCQSSDPSTSIFMLIVRNGSEQWSVNFSSGFINRVPADTTAFDTYTVTILDGNLQLNSAQKGIVLQDVPGVPDERGNAIMFGTYVRSDDSEEQRKWQLKFLRWTTTNVTP